MAEKLITHGFGVPNDPMPHQFLVRLFAHAARCIPKIGRIFCR